MKSSFQIIYLNGPSSSGKTTLALSLQDVLNPPFLHIGIDTLIEMMPKKVNHWTREGEALEGFSFKRSYDEKGLPQYEIQMGPLAKKIAKTFIEVVLTLARMGHFIIIEDVSFGNPEVNRWREALKDFNVLWIGIKTPLAILEKRERLRGDRIPGSAKDQHGKVHQDVLYDLEFDTSKEPLEKIVQVIEHTITHKESDEPRV